MPTISMPGSAATRTRAANDAANWFGRDVDVDDHTGPYAAQRLRHPIFIPRVDSTTLRVGGADRVFAIGSCFARGIEAAMVRLGFDVASSAREFDGFELAVPGVTGRGFTNKYTAFAIENELRWALDPTAEFPSSSLVDTDAGVTIDPHTNPTLKWLDRAATVDRRDLIRTVYSRAAHCRVIVVTLGLVEAWYDLEAECYLNMTPTAEMHSLCPGRYRFDLTSFEDNAASLARTVALLRQYGHRDVQVVVTVSPVPLMATYTDRDIVVANAHSKAVLRAVAEECALRYADVHYFPSYEIVTNSDPAHAWEPDRRHVKGAMVGEIMNLFVASFVEPRDAGTVSQASHTEEVIA